MTEHDDRPIGATAPDASTRFSFSLSLSIYIYTGLVVDGRGSFAAYKEIQRRDRSIRGVGLCLLSRPQKNCYKQRKRENVIMISVFLSTAEAITFHRDSPHSHRPMEQRFPSVWKRRRNCFEFGIDL